ncbi:hypothetical protein [Enterococcus faecalis]|uniref:hypothetical protein n=1 Tax=Enterococcus faecalis TaxID=1351 RepID=UPI00045A42F1|nr:hypothetical protein [Enterococcus faecalis]KAJ82436.1 hypothetical protein P791_2783 [Enterococcus faecalis NY9]
MLPEEVVKKVEERVCYEVRKQYKKEDFEQRFRFVLYERSVTFRKFRSLIKDKRFRNLSNFQEFERFMAQEGQVIVQEVVYCLNNKPKILATEFEEKVLNVLKQNVKNGTYAKEFNTFEKFKEFLDNNINYRALKLRLSEEQDSNGYIYSDGLDYRINFHANAIEREFYRDLLEPEEP